MKVTLVMMVARRDMPIAHPGIERSARKYSLVEFWRRETRTPTQTRTAMYTTTTMTSRVCTLACLLRACVSGFKRLLETACLNQSTRCHLRSHSHGCLHIAAAGAILTGYIECCSVVDRSANDRNAERDVYRSIEVDELHRDVSLIVIHRDDKIEFFANAANKDRIRRVRPGAVIAKLPRLFDGGSDGLRILMAEEIVFAGMRIQPADTDFRSTAEHKLHSLGS